MTGMDSTLLVTSFQRLLADAAPVSALRAAETAPGTPMCWEQLEASGFLDAMVPEPLGGAGLSLAEAEPLIVAMGACLLPAPAAETMVARMFAAQAGSPLPAGAVVVLAPHTAIIPLALHATHALVPAPGRFDLVRLVPAEGRFDLVRLEPAAADPFRAGGAAVSQGGSVEGAIPAGDIDLLAVAAALLAARMAGAMAQMLAMTIAHANDREQFGRPLGKFQAVQHNLAVMAEEVVSARSAARIGLAGPDFNCLRSAVAKARVSEAAQRTCSLAHAVHGAIGATIEHDLQLYTRRLMQGRLAFGSERYWAIRLGKARLEQATGTSADFVRSRLQNAG